MRALILVDHGSRLPEANALLEAVAERLRAKGLFGLVLASHMELAAPSVGVAFDTCVTAGARDITIAQYFLSPGRHSTRDIPQMAADAAKRHPEVTWRMTEPLGPAEGVIEALLERVREAGR